MSKLTIFNKKIAKTETISGDHWLMKHKSGSIFLVNRIGKTYHCCCLNKGMKDEGKFTTGYVMKRKSISEFTKMPIGFFIEIEQA